MAYLMDSLVCLADGFVECLALEELLDEKGFHEGHPRCALHDDGGDDDRLGKSSFCMDGLTRTVCE